MAPSCVDLIPGASRALVLSDVGTRAAGWAGKLGSILVGCVMSDRDPPGAMRPGQGCLARKSFSLAFMVRAAELFTEGAEALPGVLLALG